MGRSIKIADTTREERIRIVLEALGEDEFGCESVMTSRAIDAMYQPYIEGVLELRELNMQNAATSYTLSEGGAQRRSCPLQ